MGTKTISAVILTIFLWILCPVTTQTAFAQEANPLTDLIQIVYNDQNGLSTNEANAVLQTADGYLWIGGYGGLVRYDGREFRNYSMEESGLTSSAIRALFEDSAGNLWVGTNDKGVFLYENGIFIPCDAPENNLLRSIRCFARMQKAQCSSAPPPALQKLIRTIGCCRLDLRRLTKRRSTPFHQTKTECFGVPPGRDWRSRSWTGSWFIFLSRGI